MQPISFSEIVPSGAGDSAAFDAVSRREWLHTNGIGGFASGTVGGAATRRYHALLVVALKPPTERMTVLGKLDETVTINGQQFDLSANLYPNQVTYPDGWKFVVDFSAFPVPTWTYQLGTGATLIKRVYLARGKNTVYVTYTLKTTGENPPDTAGLTLTPLVEWKDYHSEMHPWASFPVRRGQEVGGWFVQATVASPTLRMRVQSAGWTPAGWWHERITHARERDRGEDFEESLFCPAVAQVTLKADQTVSFVATVEPDTPDDALVVFAEWVKHHDALLASANIAETDETGRDLVRASDAFIIHGKNIRTTLLAGYPWFTDWGRDTMIALPGLCLSTGRHEIARDILRAFDQFVHRGLIPNRFPDEGETPEYNTADATLWFIHACNEYYLATGDETFKAALAPTVDVILSAHVRGTAFGIGMDASDGLLWCGGPGLQLTWMDAKINDWVVTPRDGKPVEINALWINALRIAAAWSQNPASYTARADRACESFGQFVRPDGEGLYDVINRDGSADAAIRPNQIIAAALPTSPLSPAQTQAVLDTVEKHLLTPYGLRSLSPLDSRYQGRYAGDRLSRDGAYHQGTIWPWLIGPYVDALRRVHGPSYDAGDLLAPLLSHLRDFGVGGIAEIFDADAPHNPNGCPWQAWSLAEVLRVYRATPTR